MSKGLFAVAFIAFATMVLIFMKQSASNARKKLHEIMERFKTIDRDLKKTDVRLDSLSKVEIDSLIKANK